ncbi:MAG: transcriptional regulator [Bacillota bacterium]|nr:MAG: transcriptional regulator [Bacillota bacterium]
MSNFHRLIWFDAEVRAGRFPNATRLAQEFELSSRQGARDIEYLRYSLCAPLAYCYRHKGYYYAEQSFSLPNVHVTPEQSATLLSLSRTYELIPEEHAKNMASLFKRLTVFPSQHEAENMALPSDSHLLTGSFSVTLTLIHPGVVDFSGLNAKELGLGAYRIHTPDYRTLLIFLLSCPSEFSIVSPNWLRLKFLKMVEKALHDLSH